MKKTYGKTTLGDHFSNDMIKQVWNKGKRIQGRKSSLWRRDVYGHLINYNSYGNTKSNVGWEIDHINPKEKGGSDLLRNLQPLFWKYNRIKDDHYPFSKKKLEARLKFNEVAKKLRQRKVK